MLPGIPSARRPPPATGGYTTVTSAARRRPPQRNVTRTPIRKGTAIARIDDLMDKVESKFHLVHLAAKRAREINGYYAQLGEGLGQYVPPLVSTASNKPLSIALEEIAQAKIEGVEPTELVTEDPLAFIEGQGDDEA